MASNPRLHRLGSPLARAFCPGVSGPLSSGTWRPLSHPSRPALADPLTSFPPRAAPWAILRSPCSYRRRRPTARDPAPPRPARPAAGRYHRLCRRRNRRQSEHRSHRHGRRGISLLVHCQMPWAVDEPVAALYETLPPAGPRAGAAWQLERRRWRETGEGGAGSVGTVYVRFVVRPPPHRPGPIRVPRGQSLLGLLPAARSNARVLH